MNAYRPLLLSTSLFPLLAYAESPPPATAETGSWAQVIFGLLLVALLLAASLYLLKRLAAPRGTAALLRVISAVSLGPRERVVIIETGETWLVLGVTAAQISKLHELPRQPLPDNNTLTTRPLNQEFALRLKHFMEGKHAR